MVLLNCVVQHILSRQFISMRADMHLSVCSVYRHTLLWRAELAHGINAGRGKHSDLNCLLDHVQIQSRSLLNLIPWTRLSNYVKTKKGVCRVSQRENRQREDYREERNKLWYGSSLSVILCRRGILNEREPLFETMCGSKPYSDKELCLPHVSISLLLSLLLHLIPWQWADTPHCINN